jgi:hypothetical protein
MNFPVLISITDTDLKIKAQNDGDDILFMDNIGIATQLPHEIERYDPNTGALVAWVNLPTISSSQDTIFYLYYGNPQCPSQQNPVNTWNSNFISVWHFSEDSGPAHDSKGSHDGTATSGVTEGVPGIIDGAFGFDGSTGYVNFGNINRNMYAISFWVKPADMITPNSPAIGMLHLATTDITHYGASFGDSGDTVDNETIMIWCGIPEYRTAVVDLIISNMMFHLIVFNWNATANRYDIYFDGIQEPVVFGSEGHIPLITIWDFGIGHEYEGGHGLFYHGIVDEARLLSASLSPEWISTELTNQNDPSGFYSVGTEVTKQPEITENTVLIGMIILGIVACVAIAGLVMVFKK